MYIVDSGASMHLMGKNYLLAETKCHSTDTQITWRSKPRKTSFHKRGEGLHAGARHSLVREVGGDFASGVVSWTIGVFPLLATRRKPHVDERQENHHVLYRRFLSSRRSQPAEGYSISVPDTAMEETMQKHAGLFL